MENNQNHSQSLIIAELINKKTRRTKDNETFYTLEISPRKALTEMVLELRKEINPVSLNSQEVLYVFANRGQGNKYAYTLEINCLYAFWFTKISNPESQEDYFHVLDWRKLAADKRSIERTLRLVLNRQEEEGEAKAMTNRELLTDLKRRIKAGKISLKISAVNQSDRNTPLEIDTDLKDNDSNFRINLQKDHED